jgi:type IV fimbrial biogenesis protein FimT
VVTNSKGFTLLELMIVITILGIASALAFPGLQTMIANNRIQSSASDFVAALQFAKAEAVARVNPVTLCKSTDLTSCTDNGDWQQGWIVFSDANDDGEVNAGDGETILLSHAALDPKITFGGTALGANNGVSNSITLRQSGTSSITTVEVLIMCDDRGFDRNARGILITITGRGSVMKAADTGQIACL